jgi:hypothetical protein
VNAFTGAHGLIGRIGGREVRLTDETDAEGQTQDHGSQRQYDQRRTRDVRMAPEEAPGP